MKRSFAGGLMMRFIVVALGTGILMMAIDAFAGPTWGSAGVPLMPPSAPPYGSPLPDSGAAQRWSTDQVRMVQERTDDAYLLIIDLNGLAPENVQVRPFGRSLLVRTRRDARTHRSETFGDGRGYRERVQISVGSSTRRLPVPPDGDLAGMARKDNAEQVRVLIPRRQAGAWR
ncbi:Hsp20/alpha crystallin family protein [Halochromatium sp.]